MKLSPEKLHERIDRAANDALDGLTEEQLDARIEELERLCGPLAPEDFDEMPLDIRRHMEAILRLDNYSSTDKDSFTKDKPADTWMRDKMGRKI